METRTHTISRANGISHRKFNASWGWTTRFISKLDFLFVWKRQQLSMRNYCLWNGPSEEDVSSANQFSTPPDTSDSDSDTKWSPRIDVATPCLPFYNYYISPVLTDCRQFPPQISDQWVIDTLKIFFSKKRIFSSSIRRTPLSNTIKYAKKMRLIHE